MPKGKYKRVERNYKGIEFEKIRRKVDKKFNDLHDDLSEAYYDYWRHGESKNGKVLMFKQLPRKVKHYLMSFTG